MSLQSRFCAKIRKNTKIFRFLKLKNIGLLHGQVCVMVLVKTNVITRLEHDSESNCNKRWVRNIIIDGDEALTS